MCDEPLSPTRPPDSVESPEPETLRALGLFYYQADPHSDPPHWCFADLTGPLMMEAYSDPDDWFRRILPEDQPQVLAGRALLAQGEPWTGRYRVRGKDGLACWMEDRARVMKNSGGELIRLYGVIQDVSEYQTEKKNLLETEEQYRSLVENQGEGAVMIDAEENFLFANPAAEDLFGNPQEGLVGCNFRQFTTSDQFEVVKRQTLNRIRGEKSVYELQVVRPDGDLRTIRVTATPHFDDSGMYIGAFAVFIDVTERRKADEERDRLAAFLQMAPIPILEVDMGGKLLYANTVAKELFPDLGEEKLQHPFLSGLPSALTIMERQRLDSMVRGVQVDQVLYQQAIYATPGRRSLRIYAINITEREQAERALRVSEQRYRILVERNLAGVYRTTKGGQILDCNDAFAQILGYRSRDEILREMVESFYYDPKDRESYIHRLFLEGSLNNWEARIRRRDGKEIWILENSTLIVGESGGSITIQGTVMDITEHKRSQQLLEESLTKLSQRLEQTVQALSTLAEMKDPYTAGHQAHVTQLAVAIGIEMGLSSDQLEGLRVASTLHDLGKLYIPAEILSRPGRLSTIEFRIIQTHPTVGYEILQAIDFPWPVAEIVYQHHERQDGSGYPLGLKGEEIRLEARILAVADVVEAMSFHRPYRPAHGEEKALAEIEAKRGRCFDEQVVSVCLRLFREMNFRFQG